MDTQSSSDQHPDIIQLQHQLHTLRQAVGDMDALLDRYLTSQQALHQSEEQFRLLVTSVRDYAIFMLDPQGYIASWNTGAQLIKGYRPDEIIGRHFSVFYPAEAVAAHKPDRALQIAVADGVYTEEGWRVRKDGALFWASVVLTALYAADGTLRGFGKVTRDLTERKHAEAAQQQVRDQELQLARAQAAQAEIEANVRLRDAFLNATAHELRTPVTAVLGYAQLLQRRVERGALTLDRVQQPIRAIADHAQRMDRLITLLLESIRVEQGHLVLERAPVDLRRSLTRVVHDLQRLAERHTLALDLPSTALLVEGDAVRLQHVLYQLVQNAMKYSPEGGTITVTGQHAGPQVVILVTDEGMGIPAADLPHVFDRFYRASNLPQTTISGIGLGLYLVKEVVALHGGTVDVESAVGQGTTVRVTLPQLSEQTAAARGGA
jgi:hypothetical protein